jgi:hypothetical protein
MIVYTSEFECHYRCTAADIRGSGTMALDKASKYSQKRKKQQVMAADNSADPTNLTSPIARPTSPTATEENILEHAFAIDGGFL